MNTEILSPSHFATWANYKRMWMRLSERINRELSTATGLSEADFEILVALTESQTDTVRALALRCGLEWEKSRLSHQLKRMEARGLVMREDCFEDNRGSVIRVTELGRRLAADAKLYYEKAIEQYVFDVLSPEQIAALDATANAILSLLEEAHKS